MGWSTTREMQKRLKELAAALKADPGSIPRRLELAAALRDAERPKEAIELYRGVAESYAQEGRLVQAMAVCKGILEIDSRHRDTLEMLASLARLRASGRGAGRPEEVAGPWAGDDSTAGVPRGETLDGATVDRRHTEPEMPVMSPDGDAPDADSTPADAGPRTERSMPAVSSSTTERSMPAVSSSTTERTMPAVTTARTERTLPAVTVSRSEHTIVGGPRTERILPAVSAPRTERSMPAVGPDITERTPRFSLEESAPRSGTLVGPGPHPGSRFHTQPDGYAAEPGLYEEEPQGGLYADDSASTPAPTISSGGLYAEEDQMATRLVHDAMTAPFPKPQIEGEPPPFPLLSELPRSAFMELLTRMTVVKLPAGSTILREGEIGDACYLIASGSVRVTKGATELAVLSAGSFFGEFAVLADQRRHATVETIEPVELLELRRSLLDELIDTHAGVARTLRRFYRDRLLATLLATAPFFSGLTPEERAPIAERFRPRRFGRGARIIEEGAPGGGLFLVLVGEVEVIRGNTEEIELGRVGEGSYFGEMSLLRGSVATATVRAARTTEVVQLAPRDFYEIVSQHPILWEHLRAEAERRAIANHALLTGEARKNEDGSIDMRS